MGTKKELFLRPASGLVREVSTLNALAFNIAAETGAAGASGIAFMVFAAPAALLLGFPPYTWGSVTLGIFCVVYCLLFVVLTTAMPRTGGDYVFSSRIMHPFLGWIEAWTFVWSMLPFLAFSAWLGVFGIYVQFAANAVIIPNSGWATSAALLQPKDNTMILGTIVMIVVGIVTMLPTKTYHRILTVTSVICMSALVILGAASLFANPAVFEANFVKYFGYSTQQMVQDAMKDGWNPGVFDIRSFGPLLAYMMLLFIGFVFSAFMAGELKGNVGRNTLIASLGAIAWIVFIQGFFILPWIHLGGLNTIYAWSYLYWNGFSAPLGAPPYTNVMMQIAMPELTGLWTVLGILVGSIFMIIIIPVWATTSIRMFFAFAMDRMMPKKLAEVNERTHSPLYLTVLVTAIGIALLYQTVYGFSPMNTSWYTVLLSFLVWIFPGFNAILLPFRRRDLYELVPATWKRRIAGVPLIALLGLIWIAFAIPVYVAEFLLPLTNSLMLGGAALVTSVQGGISMTLAVLVVGIIWYFVAYYYNKSKGIDMSLLYKSLPPD